MERQERTYCLCEESSHWLKKQSERETMRKEERKGLAKEIEERGEKGYREGDGGERGDKGCRERE